ncbi:MAG: CRISPR-associated endonuclease Cas2 [Phycisphaerales bacterium]|nr:CRISPR-associated endonuclease Cas2 [Phycisphaerales bacterium]
MAIHQSWYLLAYDIRDPKRLRQVHHYLRKRGLAAQQSVFFLHVTDTELRQTLEGVTQRIHRHLDDVRAYPISHPAEVWLAGQSAVVGPLLQPPQASINQKKPSLVVKHQGLWGLVTRLWGKHHG